MEYRAEQEDWINNIKYKIIPCNNLADYNYFNNQPLGLHRRKLKDRLKPKEQKAPTFQFLDRIMNNYIINSIYYQISQKIVVAIQPTHFFKFIHKNSLQYSIPFACYDAEFDRL